MLPSSQTNAKRSTSGSTVIPKSACTSRIFADKSVKCSGRGSGLCGKCPVGSQYISVIFVTPNARNIAGTKIPPVEFTASTTMLKSAAAIAALSTNGRAKMASMCFCKYESSLRTLPKSSTSAKIKRSCSAILNTSSPSFPLMNSPFSFNNFKAFHCFGLWLAVKIIPPCACSNGTATSTVGVVESPRLITSIPSPSRVETTKSDIMAPEMRASRPMTTQIFCPGFRSINQEP